LGYGKRKKNPLVTECQTQRFEQKEISKQIAPEERVEKRGGMQGEKFKVRPKRMNGEWSGEKRNKNSKKKKRKKEKRR